MSVCTLACQATIDCPAPRAEACPWRTGGPPVAIPGQEALPLDSDPAQGDR